MKKINVKIIILLFIILFINITHNQVYAEKYDYVPPQKNGSTLSNSQKVTEYGGSEQQEGNGEYSAGTIISGAQGFLSAGQANNHISDADMKPIVDVIYNILLTIAIIIAFIIGSFLGIKLIVGSVEEQADVKKSLVPFVAGLVVVFGAFTIWKIVLTILQ